MSGQALALVEKWGRFELKLACSEEPLAEEQPYLVCRFTNGLHYGEAEGFPAEAGSYLIRFMPGEEGIWTYVTQSSCPDMDGISGEFACTAPSPGNRGPVQVQDEAHFAYADGTRYVPLGTVSYAWHLGDEHLLEQTLESLQASPFNKLRMAVLPGSGQVAFAESAAARDSRAVPSYAAAGADTGKAWPGPDYFTRLDRLLARLDLAGIEAELVLFQPHTPCAEGLSLEDEERYVRYCAARYGAFRNVWWSLCEEPEAFAGRLPEDWNRLFRVLQEWDCGGHMRSLLSRPEAYDFGVPWVTHASLKSRDVRIASDLTKAYGKPVILDDCGGEGNLDTDWTGLNAEEMVCRLWEATARGGFAAYRECYLRPDGTQWQVQGGELGGVGIQRVAFLSHILESNPPGMSYNSDRYDAATLEIRGECYLQYFGPHRFAYRGFDLPEGRYEAELIDTWNMTITPLPGVWEGRFRIDLPGKLYYALRLRRQAAAEELS
ncbi:DUF5605 domain-containing protein [Paenibacillus puerhi]|uniref:DUF5605 domain-containing protein n=1 Tax=Paenibacillus puerhi TaxID=2692622 RepID=UPI0013579414|nr:DUF5605 domain-containing protein [Paenibacillus puerhi]